MEKKSKEILCQLRETLKDYKEYLLFVSGDFNFENSEMEHGFGVDPNQRIYMLPGVGKVYTDGKMTKETLVCKLGKMRKEYLVCDIKDATWNLLIDYPRTGTMTVQVNDHEVIKCLRKDNRYHQI